MQETIMINENSLQIKEWNGQRVMTLADIDKVHERRNGTASRNFIKNKRHLIENEDYFILKPSDIQNNEKRCFQPSNRGTTYLTESGYLLLVKSFTDPLAWKVQRQLVNTYFKFKEVVQNFSTNYPIDTNELTAFLQEVKKHMPCIYAQINNIETTLESVVDNMTLSTRQQEKIHETARKRINFLLGGAHSKGYKEHARSYMINLWNSLKSNFHCGSSYKDLHPSDFDNAMKFINRWEYDG